jgi:hypothetical protein
LRSFSTVRPPPGILLEVYLFQTDFVNEDLVIPIHPLLRPDVGDMKRREDAILVRWFTG